MVGEHLFVYRGGVRATSPSARLPTDSPLVRKLRAKHIIKQEGDELPLELLALKARTRYRRLPEFTGCTSSSSRCAASTPVPTARSRGRARTRSASTCPPETAMRWRWSWPSDRRRQLIKIEFQGGEPLLNFDADRGDRPARPSAINDRARQGSHASSSRPTSRCSTTRCSTSAAPTTSTSRPRSTVPPTSTTRTGPGQAATAGSARSTGSGASARRLARTASRR